MFELGAMGNYVLTMVICLVFIMVLLSRQKRTGKDLAVWLFSGIVGIMLGIGGTLAAINLTDHQIVEKFEIVHEDTGEEDTMDSEGGGGGGRGGGRGGGGRGAFDPAAFFAERDADGDGKLAGDEISDRMAEDLEEIDTDGDGAVTLEEFQARMQSRFGGRGRGRGGEGGDDDSEEDEEESVEEESEREAGEEESGEEAAGEESEEGPDQPQLPESEE